MSLYIFIKYLYIILGFLIDSKINEWIYVMFNETLDNFTYAILYEHILRNFFEQILSIESNIPH